MKTVPYMYFNGNASEAIKFYEKVFNTPAAHIMLFNEMPNADPANPFGDKVLHAEILIGDDVYYVSDAVGAEQVTVGNNLQINLNCESEEELRQIFAGLSEGAAISMPVQDTFWGAIYGALTDRFGISWSLNFQKQTE